MVLSTEIHFCSSDTGACPITGTIMAYQGYITHSYWANYHSQRKTIYGSTGWNRAAEWYTMHRNINVLDTDLEGESWFFHISVSVICQKIFSRIFTVQNVRGRWSLEVPGLDSGTHWSRDRCPYHLYLQINYLL